MSKRTSRFIALAAGLGLSAFLVYGYRLALIGSAYKAKILCSNVFVSLRDPQSISDAELSAGGLGILRRIDARIDRDARTVTASLFGFASRKAAFREGQGCAVMFAEGAGSTFAPPRSSAKTSRPFAATSHDFPLSKSPSSEFNPRQLNAVIEQAFSEIDQDLPRHTRAVVIVHKGRLVAERYAPGFSAQTPLPGWSMAKSVVNALVGILVKEGKIGLRSPAPIPEWQRPGDPRRKITIEQLLHMSSGLQFDESYRYPLADVIVMLLGSPGAAAFAIAKPLDAEPGTQWRYSSGTTNVIAYAIRQIIGEAEYLQFPRKALFDRIGMGSAVLETDSTGTFVGSSFMFATARDWARLGMLYGQDGVWNAERILPEGWVEFSRTPAPRAPERQYGAHFWLSYPPENQCKGDFPPFPDDAFHAIGHQGQYLTIVPSRETVVVRLGLTSHPCAWNHRAFVRSVLQALD
jgi:hypothetical protein